MLQIQKFAPRFMGYNQQDAQEFLRYLLEGLHEDVNRIAVKPRPLEHDISDDLRYVIELSVHSTCWHRCPFMLTVIQRRPWNPGSVTWEEMIQKLWIFSSVNSNRLYSALSAVTAASRLILFGIFLCLSHRPANPVSSCTTVSIFLEKKKYSTVMKNR